MVLSLSKITSNYGTSLIRPLLAYLWLVLPVYLLYIICSNDSSSTFEKCYEIPSKLSIVESIKFFIPIRAFDPNLIAFALSLDILGRVASTFLIYNFIRATRRFIS